MIHQPVYRLFVCVCLCMAVLVAPARAAEGDDPVVPIQRVNSPGGISAWLVEDHSVPVISMRFAFRGGVELDPEGKEGLSYLLSTMLDEGAGAHESEAFQQLLDDNAISLGFSAGREVFSGQLRTLREKKDLAFELTALAINKPRFDADPLSRMRNAALSRISNNMSRPGWLAARSFNGMIFEGHPYARPGQGTLESVKTITADDLRNHVQKYFGRDNLIVAVAGDITAAELAGALDDMFGTLPKVTQRPAVDKAELKYPGKTILFPYDVPQTVVSVGQPGITRDHPDWHAAQIMNYVLGGGGFGSRLMEELREKRGLTYGVYTGLQTTERTGLIRADFNTVNASVGEALDLLRAEWRKMAENGISEQELEDARSYMLGALPLQMTSTGDIAGILLSLQIDGMKITYLDEREGLIKSVTLADVNRVAKELLKPESLTTILVGRPEGVTPDITLDKPPGIPQNSVTAN